MKGILQHISGKEIPRQIQVFLAAKVTWIFTLPRHLSTFCLHLLKVPLLILRLIISVAKSLLMAIVSTSISPLISVGFSYFRF